MTAHPCTLQQHAPATRHRVYIRCAARCGGEEGCQGTLNRGARVCVCVCVCVHARTPAGRRAGGGHARLGTTHARVSLCVLNVEGQKVRARTHTYTHTRARSRVGGPGGCWHASSLPHGARAGGSQPHATHDRGPSPTNLWFSSNQALSAGKPPSQTLTRGSQGSLPLLDWAPANTRSTRRAWLVNTRLPRQHGKPANTRFTRPLTRRTWPRRHALTSPTRQTRQHALHLPTRKWPRHGKPLPTRAHSPTRGGPHLRSLLVSVPTPTWSQCGVHHGASAPVGARRWALGMATATHTHTHTHARMHAQLTWC